MPRNASGTYTLPAGNPVAAGTLVEAAWANTTLNDLGAEMTDSLSRSGEGGMLVSFKIADGTVALPGLAFTLEPGTGLSRLGTNEFDFSVGGSRVIQLTVNGMTVTAGLSVLVDTINESTADAGVTVEGIKLKDSKIEFSDIVTIDSPVAGELALNATVVDLDATTVEFTGTTVDIDATTLDIVASTLDIDATTITLDAVASIDLTAPAVTVAASTEFQIDTGTLDINAATEVQIDTGTLDINATTIVDIDTNAESSMLTLDNAHLTEAEIGLFLTKASAAGYGAKFVAGSDVWLAGDDYSFFADGGELRNNNESGQTYICRFYNSDGAPKLNFYVKDNGTVNCGTDGSSPYNFTTALAANCNLVGTGIVRRSTSSLRFKSNVEPIDSSWADKLLELKPINYKSTAPADGDVDSSWTFYGFGAEDVALIDPRYVFFSTHKNVHDEATGDNTSVLLDEAIPEGVQYDRMVPALIDIIKRLEKRVAVLES